MGEEAGGAFPWPVLYEGSTKLKAFVGLCHFMVNCLKDRVMDVHFPFQLPVFGEVTIRQIGCS